MSKGSGGNRKSSSSKPAAMSQSTTKKAQTVQSRSAKINFGSAPANNSSKQIHVGDRVLTVRAAPTGYGNQQKRNGRFTVYENGKSIYSETWGDGYGFYTSKSQAWREVKSYITRFIK